MATDNKYAFATEGATLTLGSGGVDIKANLIDAPDFDNPEPTLNEVEASDRTKYTFNGTEATPTITVPVIFTDDNVESIMNSVYGAGTAIANGTSWDLTGASGTLDEIRIKSAQSTGGYYSNLVAVNPTGIRIKINTPLFNGFQGEVRFKATKLKYQKTSA